MMLKVFPLFSTDEEELDELSLQLSSLDNSRGLHLFVLKIEVGLSICLSIAALRNQRRKGFSWLHIAMMANVLEHDAVILVINAAKTTQLNVTKSATMSTI
jgi:hypothetical protein